MNTNTNTNTNNTSANVTHLIERRQSERQAQSGSDRLSAQYRERDFGIGYGASSGYVRNRSYTSASNRPLFRVA
ncbi:MAG: hypothetical protein Q8L45_06230 [Xanthomonadaceae bacterium]|nr:hypothetical protein [Xanthomonadaceae bacterium]MDP2186801.1 hypothetical protein [Xanthomonadales bacterium]MDZ4117518.1 hypothetical protein [Xanthomonadaceae bacterium]